jgi:hypothetical protein
MQDALTNHQKQQSREIVQNIFQLTNEEAFHYKIRQKDR